MQIQFKRVYDAPSTTDGLRVLVDRLWPRGLTKNDAAIDVWAKKLAPSSELRKWFAHKDESFGEFTRRYDLELDSVTAEIDKLLSSASSGKLTLLYAARNQTSNHAVVLQEWDQAPFKRQLKASDLSLLIHELQRSYTMSRTTQNFDNYAFSKQPDYHELTVRKAFAKAIPLKTVVIYCYDPRAVGVPKAVAKELNEVYPGDIVTDAEGNKVASTTSLFEVVVAGGRAVDALRSITVAQHLFGIENIVIVHHTHCGATSFTADGIIDAYKHEHDADISRLYERESICISDYEASLMYDTRLVRESQGTPKHVDIYGYVYDIDTSELSLVVEDQAKTVAP